MKCKIEEKKKIKRKKELKKENGNKERQAYRYKEKIVFSGNSFIVVF